MQRQRLAASMAACRVSGVLEERLFLAAGAGPAGPELVEALRLSGGAFFGGIAAMLEPRRRRRGPARCHHKLARTLQKALLVRE